MSNPGGIDNNIFVPSILGSNNFNQENKVNQMKVRNMGVKSSLTYISKWDSKASKKRSQSPCSDYTPEVPIIPSNQACAIRYKTKIDSAGTGKHSARADVIGKTIIWTVKRYFAQWMNNFELSSKGSRARVMNDYFEKLSHLVSEIFQGDQKWSSERDIT